MEFRNYIPVKTLSPRYIRFCFMDANEYLADALFIKHKVKVRFGREYRNNKLGYVWIFCKVRKKDVDRFLDALEDLKRKMLLCGYTNYQEYCELVTKKGIRNV